MNTEFPSANRERLEIRRNDQSDCALKLIAALECDELIVEPAIERARSEMPSYREVSSELLAASNRRNLALVCRCLREQKIPEVGDIWQAEKTTLERLHAGVPIEDAMGGFRVSIASIQERMVVIAGELGVGDSDVVRLTRLLWKLSDAFSARGAATYRQHRLVLAVAEQRKKDEWLSRLLSGDLSIHQVKQGCAAYGLGHTYRAFCTNPLDDETMDTVHRAMAEWPNTDGEMLAMPTDGKLVGIVASNPMQIAGCLLAIGPPERVDRANVSFGGAKAVLDATMTHYSEGVYTLEDVGWRIAVPAVDRVSNLVRGRYLDPLLETGEFGRDVIDNLRSYLENERSIPRTAAAQHIHVNTLRYRLTRFEELTGASLQNTNTLIELSWALHLESPFRS